MANLKTKLAEILNTLKIKKPAAIVADDPLTADNWNNVVSSIDELTKAITAINSITPSLPLVGYKYFQFPGEKLPWDLYPATAQSDWTALHSKYPGVALRLAGGNASAFKKNSVYVSYDETIKGQGGGQKDALQKHFHRYNNRYIKWGSYENVDYNSSGSNSYKNIWDDNVDTSYEINCRADSTETRMINITVQVWEYRADLNNH